MTDTQLSIVTSSSRMRTLVAATCWILHLLLGLTGAHASPWVNKCQTRYFNQPKDHFAFKSNPPSFKQRVLYNLEHFKEEGPIFFYLGNEADVELYVDHTGLMWENAEAFGAAVVFAEHRYYGKSRLFADDACDMSLLTTEQALADFAVVVDTFKRELNASAVIGFGGSYGGMLATVFKFQYSHLVDGVIAASAPVRHFRFISLYGVLILETLLTVLASPIAGSGIPRNGPSIRFKRVCSRRDS